MRREFLLLRITPTVWRFILPSMDDSSFFCFSSPYGSNLMALLAPHLPKKICIQYASPLNIYQATYIQIVSQILTWMWVARWQLHGHPGIWTGLCWQNGADCWCQDYYQVYTGTTDKRRPSLTALTPYAPDHNILIGDHTFEALIDWQWTNNISYTFSTLPHLSNLVEVRPNMFSQANTMNMSICYKHRYTLSFSFPLDLSWGFFLH